MDLQCSFSSTMVYSTVVSCDIALTLPPKMFRVENQADAVLL